MQRHHSRFGSRWTARLLAMVLLGLPVLSVGLASPAAAWGGGDYGGGYNTTPCPSGTAAVTNISFVINATTRVVTLGGNARSGLSVTATFDIAKNCKNIQVSLAAYRAPSATYDRNTASQQVLFDSSTGTFSPVTHTLQIFVPAGCFQVDFVLGPVITKLGPANTSNFYGDQNRLIDHDNNCTNNGPPQAPGCVLTAVLDGPPKQLVVTVQDSTSGLKSIAVTTLTNATVAVPTFTPGSAQSYVVVATKIDPTQTAYLGLQVTNMAGLITDCDPPF
ncbi:MAG: hypothetical protein QOJ52_141 [Acidimicrobiaceae bacterium]|nr:hypothetical protein [Acidimicrobiaceae bacterium]